MFTLISLDIALQKRIWETTKSKKTTACTRMHNDKRPDMTTVDTETLHRVNLLCQGAVPRSHRKT